MARQTMGPRIGRLRETDDEGRFRETHWDYFPSSLILDALNGLRSLPFENGYGGYHSRLRHFGIIDPGLIHEVDEVVRGDGTPADDVLNDRLLHTNFEYWRANHATWYPRPYPHRVLINAHVTTAGNLSVRFSPACLGPGGRWRSAPEWNRIPFLGHSNFRERPNDEVMFIRNVENLFVDRLEHRRRYYREETPLERDWVPAACKAVNMAFWLVVYRLSNRFEVHLGHYVTMLTSGIGKQDCLGLQIVDALEEHRGALRTQFEGFERDTGHTPQEFWDACEASDGRRSFNLASKALRRPSGPAAKLTPSVVETYHRLLKRAEEYGIWMRGDPQWHAADETGFGLDEEMLPELTGIMLGWQRFLDDEDAVPSQADPGAAIGTTPVQECPGLPAPAAPVEDPLAPPSYDGLPQARLSDKVKAEFGLEKARDLVDRLNELWRAQGRRPMPRGIFPTNASKLKYVVEQLRKASAQERPTSGPTG